MNEAATPGGSASDSGNNTSAGSRSEKRQVPRRMLAELNVEGRDPLGIIAEQNTTRVQDLVPLRAKRMSASPFAFYRGTAAIQAADLAASAHSGILVASCGDAHVSNFGFYASPQRTIVADLNDFDEAAWAPWEWDVKRLVTSVIIGGRASGRDSLAVEESARDAVGAYVHVLQAALELSPLERYYTHFDVKDTKTRLKNSLGRVLVEAVADAKKRTGQRAVRRLTRKVEGGDRQFVENPPAMVRVGGDDASRTTDLLDQYRLSANVDVRMLLSQYDVKDVARRAVGVGSVGTRCFVVLLHDREGNLLLLQVKQARRSVLEEYGGIRQPSALTDGIARGGGEGARVVALQRVLQAFSDPFLGHLRGPVGDFYVRQFHDMKGGIEVEGLDDVPFRRYAMACGVMLARAHAQSPNLREVVEYIGNGRRVTDGIVAWSEAYADLSLADYRAFVASSKGKS
ncbi:MAG TPA: DUF2252 domain-containing protein [Actinomycetaceae bacterium]|nr:DUF2252 domain-containing protein [Actinomycetaceae bacterium]